MRLIAHRGNINGKNPFYENSPKYCQDAIDKGFDVEIDLRLIDQDFFLGHDRPEMRIELEEILKLASSLWIHCKNIQVLNLYVD